MLKLTITILLLFGMTQYGATQEFSLLTPPLMDLGTAYGDTLLHGTIRFMNAGDKTLKIARIQASCGCTATQLDKLIYEAGEQGEITVQFNTKGQHSGLARKFVTIFMEEGQPSSFRITLQANIKDYVQLEPAFIDFQEISLAAKNHQRTITITNNYKQLLIIKNLNTNIPALEIPGKEVKIQPGTSFTIHIKINPVKEGRNDGYIDFNITQPMAQSKRLPVFVKVVR